ncbi:ionic transporter y4hA [Compostibacter hankyongensis]|uniref:Ionic transporter y4hA n=1 Tax=Compostibacter hankyongensis TaxID=1007089 RepID=A0ABP8G952_9BACT
MKNLSLPYWIILTPIIAWLLILLKGSFSGILFVIVLSIVLITAVLAAVHLAEVIAHRVGEPFGTLILALAVTIIELSLIITLMSSGGEQSISLARDTIFAANMIILNGIVGLCLLTGGIKFHEQSITQHSATSALVALSSILVLTMVFPNYTQSTPGPVYHEAQLIFISIICIVLYAGFIFVQSVRHRDYFLPSGHTADDHAALPNNRTTLVSLILLLICLGAVVLMAKALSPAIEAGVTKIGAPQSLVGIIIAMIILLPEGIAAFNAARANRLQTSVNLALGSALASTGLTIPAVGIYSVFGGSTILLGINTGSTVLLLLSIFTVMLSLITGKTNLLYGIVLLVIFATYLFTSIIP